MQSTTAGENLVVQALRLPVAGANIVTDGLHFEGSLYLYDALRKRGADIRIVKPRNWRIDMEELNALSTGTRALFRSRWCRTSMDSNTI